jgi:hypothetical protein
MSGPTPLVGLSRAGAPGLTSREAHGWLPLKLGV